MKNDILVSFCIPTYNRKTQLVELVDSILSIDRDNIEIVITDNCSTDETLYELSKVNDRRLKVYTNEAPLPALQNMIQAIFNGSGKYIFYFNDREIAYPDKIRAFISFLEDRQLAFVHVTQKKKDTRNTCSFYRKGFESLLHQQCTHHPSGMVFNGELLRGKLKKEHYFSYLADQYTYSYLMRDMLQYGDSAIYDYGCWNQRPPEYLKNTRSGSNTTKTLYFYPEISYVNVKDVFNQVFAENDYGLSRTQRIDTAIYIGKYFAKRILDYKYYMMSDTETAHYQIDMRFVSYMEMCSIMNRYCRLTENLLEEYGFDKAAKKRWKAAEITAHLNNLKSSLYLDYKRYIRRMIW